MVIFGVERDMGSWRAPRDSQILVMSCFLRWGGGYIGPLHLNSYFLGIFSELQKNSKCNKERSHIPLIQFALMITPYITMVHLSKLRNRPLVHYYKLKSRRIRIHQFLYQCPFFCCSGSNPGNHFVFSCHVFLVSFCQWQVHSLSLFSWPSPF